MDSTSIEKLDDWTQWSLADSLAERRRFKLRPGAMETLQAQGLPDSLLTKLKPLAGKIHLTQKEFLDATEKALGHAEFERHKESLIRQATLPNDGGGPDTLAQLLLGRATLKEEKSVAESYNAIRDLLLEWQEPNGSWLAAGQLPSLRWENEKEMNDATTLWSILAVGAGKPGETSDRNRERALKYLHETQPGITLQSLAAHLMVAHQVGESSRVETLRRELLARQNTDGGWSSIKTNTTSDAFATGQALYALGRLGSSGNDPVVQRAWSFLLRTQEPDGHWEVRQDAINTRPRKLNVYNYWGTAWAAIGLLQTLPLPVDTR